MAGALFIVATPLGNLEDLSPRGLQTLREVDRIACEDTRRTGKLLAHFGVQTPLLSFHEHNEEARASQILDLLRGGEKIALVSDAGTPLISDPGYRLVRMCRREGIAVIPVPGPCAAVAALSASGLATDRFLFAGFTERKPSALRRQLQGLAAVDCTLVFYLSPHRLPATMAEFAREWGERRGFLVREMTKIHESSHFGTLTEIAEAVAGESARGEYTLVVEGAAKESTPAAPPLDVLAYVAGLQSSRGLSRSQAVQRAARELGLKKQEIYRLLES